MRGDGTLGIAAPARGRPRGAEDGASSGPAPAGVAARGAAAWSGMVRTGPADWARVAAWMVVHFLAKSGSGVTRLPGHPTFGAPGNLVINL